MATKIYNGLDLTGTRIINSDEPAASSDVATKNYVDTVARGMDWKASCRAATTANIATLAGGAPNTLDGVTLAANDRILVKDQTTGGQNGIYFVATLGTGANGTWTRDVDADVSAEVTSGLATTVTAGTANGDKVFVLATDDPITLGTTALTFVTVGAGGSTYSADGQGIEVSSTVFSLELDGTTLAKSATGLRVGSGAAGAGLTEASGVLAVGDGGAGITVNANDVALDFSVVVQKFAVDCAAATSTVCTHNFGTKDVTVAVYRKTTPFDLVITDVEMTSTNTVTVRFATAPAAGDYRIVIHG